MVPFKLNSDAAAVVSATLKHEKATLKSLELLFTEFLVQIFLVYAV